AAGPFATSGIVSGTSVSSLSGVPLGPVTIDSRTLTTNYNVADNHKTMNETWVRGRFERGFAPNVMFKTQLYDYEAHRDRLNSETFAFNAATGLVDRDRFYVPHDQNQIGDNSSV